MKPIATSPLALAALVAGLAYGHSVASGIVKARMDAMEDMADKSKLVADMFKGKSEFDKQALVDAADSFTRHGTEMDSLFPDTVDSRNGSDTDALPGIWQERDNFTKQVNDFLESSESLKKIISETDDISQLKKAFFKTTKDCSGCHKRFRRPKD